MSTAYRCSTLENQDGREGTRLAVIPKPIPNSSMLSLLGGTVDLQGVPKVNTLNVEPIEFMSFVQNVGDRYRTAGALNEIGEGVFLCGVSAGRRVWRKLGVRCLRAGKPFPPCKRSYILMSVTHPIY